MSELSDTAFWLFFRFSNSRIYYLIVLHFYVIK
ncbi:hypothetical protein T11_84 [Trichinella zimbabwensis]|uniref:Uncharacterized protein n=1 Tax=Trichinella zimbabwensis TaxID=268475 RepID=A0A0V1F754_9BILA|nr:hypothetical protein T11_84 [Trichinella zimbabwensis]